MELIVYDEDITKDDEVGRTRFSLRELGLINNKQNDRILQLNYYPSKDKVVPAGTLQISTLFSF